jgi:hypothetical protein
MRYGKDLTKSNVTGHEKDAWSSPRTTYWCLFVLLHNFKVIQRIQIIESVIVYYMTPALFYQLNLICFIMCEHNEIYKLYLCLQNIQNAHMCYLTHFAHQKTLVNGVANICRKLIFHLCETINMERILA